MQHDPLDRHDRSKRGQAVVEFSFAVVLLFMLTFGIVEFSHLFYTELTLQHALREAGRYAVTGQGYTTNPNDRLTAIQNKFCQKLIGTGLSCTNISSHLAVTCTGGCTQPAGGPGQTVVLTATFTKPWFSSLIRTIVGSTVTFTLSTTWKNEPYTVS